MLLVRYSLRREMISPPFIFLRRLRRRLSSSARVSACAPPFVLRGVYFMYSLYSPQSVKMYEGNGSEEYERRNPVFASGIGVYIVNVGVVTGHASHWFFFLLSHTQLFFNSSFSFRRALYTLLGYVYSHQVSRTRVMNFQRAITRRAATYTRRDSL